jgi:hypothetical protein
MMGGLMADECMDKRDIHMLSGIHNPPAKGNFCDEKWCYGATNCGKL